MKKILIGLVAVLVIVFVVLSFMGRKDGYSAEQLFHRAMQTTEEIAANPDVAPPALLSSVEDDLTRIISEFPDAEVTKAAHMSLAEFYLNQNNFDKARAAVDDMIAKYRDDDVFMSRALFLKGIIFERSGNWNRALEEFTSLRDNYTVTQLGMQVPLYVANYYERMGSEAQANRAYRDALEYYRSVEREHSGTGFGYLASSFMLQTSLIWENFTEAGDIMEFIISNYPSPISFRQLLPYVEAVYVEMLGQPERAIAVYRNIDRQVADESLTEILDARIEEIEATI